MEIEQRDGITILRLSGAELGTEEAGDLKSRAFDALPQTEARVAIDMSSVVFMDSSGLSALIAVMKRTGSGAGDFVLFGVRPAVREILNLTRLDSVFSVCSSEEEAMALFRRTDSQKERRRHG